MILKLGFLHQEPELYKLYINDDPEMTLTYFTPMSNLDAYTFEWEKLSKSHLMVKTCSK